MPAFTDCPRCRSSHLTAGVIVGRSPGVKFKANKGFAADLTGIPLTDGFLNHTAPAVRCGAKAAVRSWYSRSANRRPEMREVNSHFAGTVRGGVPLLPAAPTGARGAGHGYR